MPALTEVREIHYASAFTFSELISLPAGTQVGDAILLTTNGSISSSIYSGGDQFHTTINPLIGDPGTRYYVGVLNRLDPIGVTVETGTGVRSAHVQILTLTGTLDVNRVSQNGMNGDPSGNVVIPAIPGKASGALVSVVGWKDIGGPVWYGASGGVVTETWNNLPTTANYHLIAAGWTPERKIVGDVTISGSVTWMNGLLIGVGVPPKAAAPCRLIRDDDLGVGGARLYPPPKSQQRSSRGVGYY